jgi:hypothetical protein
MKRLSLLAVFLSLAVSVRADSFTTLDGDSYTNCTVKRVEPDGIVITDSDGVHKLKFKNLPPDIGKKYGFDSVKAAAWQEKNKQSEISSQKEAVENQQNQLKHLADQQTEFDTWEPFSTTVKNGNSWGYMNASETESFLSTLKKIFTPLIEDGTTDRSTVHEWVSAIWNHEIQNGMPAIAVKLSWGDPSSTSNDSSGWEMWTYERGNGSGQYIHFKDGVVSSWSNL